MAAEQCPHPSPDCPFDTPFADDHHQIWPACEYTTPLEKRYRGLEINIVRGVCRCLHNLAHTFPPPEKPSVDEMRLAVEQARVVK